MLWEIIGVFFYTLFFIGLVIEVVSIVLDARRMLGKPGPSGAFGVSMGLFALFAMYGVFLSSANRTMWNRELIAAWLLIGFQLVFHVAVPLIFVYLRKKPDSE